MATQCCNSAPIRRWDWAFTYRMAPGMTTRAHQHRGDEQFLVLEGELFDNDGTRYRAGDLVWLRDGTQHSSYTATGCLLAVHIAGPETSLE